MQATMICGDGHGREILVTAPLGQARLLRAIERAADPEDGTIQAWSMVRLFPGQPEAHRTCHISYAVRLAGFTVTPAP